MKRFFNKQHKRIIPSQGVIRETNDAAETKKKISDWEKAVEDFMKTYYERVQKNDLENLKNMVEDTNEFNWGSKGNPSVCEEI